MRRRKPQDLACFLCLRCALMKVSVHLFFLADTLQCDCTYSARLRTKYLSTLNSPCSFSCRCLAGASCGGSSAAAAGDPDAGGGTERMKWLSKQRIKVLRKMLKDNHGKVCTECKEKSEYVERILDLEREGNRDEL